MKPTLFVGSSGEGLEYARAVHEHLERDALVTVWDAGVFDLSASTLESLVRTVSRSDFGAFVMGPDDVATIRSQVWSVPRDNVIFELGLFVGVLGMSRTFILIPHDSPSMKLPTDLLGVTAAKFEANRADGNLLAGMGTACSKIRRAISTLGHRTLVTTSATGQNLPIDSGVHGQADSRFLTGASRSKEDPVHANRRPPAIAASVSPGPLIPVRHGVTLVDSFRHMMVSVPCSEFVMGGDRIERARVTIPRPFEISPHLVSQALYREVMGGDPSRFKGDNLPVDSVSWMDAVAFCNRLSKIWELEEVYTVVGQKVRADLSRNGARLPTEIEWEYACLGGADRGAHGSLDEVAWYGGNSGGKTRPIATRAPNRLGLYDMLGNVWEWCSDWYQRDLGDACNPAGPESGVERVVRGGSWNSVRNSVSASYRFRKHPSLREDDSGIRIARTDPASRSAVSENKVENRSSTHG